MNSFLFHSSYLHIAEGLPPNRRDKLFGAILVYALEGEEPDFKGELMRLWRAILPGLKESVRAQGLAIKRREAGAKGGSAKPAGSGQTGAQEDRAAKDCDENPNSEHMYDDTGLSGSDSAHVYDIEQKFACGFASTKTPSKTSSKPASKQPSKTAENSAPSRAVAGAVAGAAVVPWYLGIQKTPPPPALLSHSSPEGGGGGGENKAWEQAGCEVRSGSDSQAKPEAKPQAKPLQEPVLLERLLEEKTQAKPEANLQANCQAKPEAKPEANCQAKHQANICLPSTDDQPQGSPEHLPPTPASGAKAPAGASEAKANPQAGASAAAPARAAPSLLREAGFNVLYNSHPCKLRKEEAHKAWLALAPNEDLTLLAIVANSKQCVSSKWLAEEGKYVPFLENWIAKKRWQDYNPELYPNDHAQRTEAAKRRLRKEADRLRGAAHA